MKRIPWTTPKWPLPANDGARQATKQLVAALCSKGSLIDLVAMVPKGEEVSESEAIEALGVRSVTVVRRPKTGNRLHLQNLLQPNAASKGSGSIRNKTTFELNRKANVSSS